MSRSKSCIAVAAIVVVTALAAVALPEKAEALTLKQKLTIAKRALKQSNQRLKVAEKRLAAALTARAAAAALTAAAASAEPGAGTEPGAEPTPGAEPPAVTEPVPGGDPTATPTPSVSPSPTTSAAPLVAAVPAPSAARVKELKAWVAKLRKVAQARNKRVKALTRQYRQERQIAKWERQGNWRAIIKVVAAKYRVSASGMYRVMMRESTGRRYAGAHHAYKGLFQYCYSTWKASWNPWRRSSIYDPSSQIFASAYAISKGWGPRMWTTFGAY